VKVCLELVEAHCECPELVEEHGLPDMILTCSRRWECGAVLAVSTATPCGTFLILLGNLLDYRMSV
jgi:hypothetical protein